MACVKVLPEHALRWVTLEISLYEEPPQATCNIACPGIFDVVSLQHSLLSVLMRLLSSWSLLALTQSYLFSYFAS